MSWGSHIAQEWINYHEAGDKRKPLTDAQAEQLRHLARGYLELVGSTQYAQTLATLQGRRAEFTKAALTGILARVSEVATPATIARESVYIADQVLLELRGRPPSLEPMEVFESVTRARRGRQLAALADHLRSVNLPPDTAHKLAEQLLAIVEATP